MRKKPVFNEKTCSKCNKTFLPTGRTQIYCSECKITVAKETKKRWYEKNNPTAYAPKTIETCAVCGDDFSSHFNGVPYCNKHYLKMKFYGTIESARKSKNTYEIEGDIAEIKTSKGEIFLTDCTDLDFLLKYSWCINKNGYVVANINHKVTKIHQYILGLSTPVVVDHINGNKLDNRRENLRICTSSENSKNMKIKTTNRTGYPGIRLTPSGRYNVRITVNNKEIHVGNYLTLEEGIGARKNAEIEYYGEFAPSLGVLKK